MPEVRNLENAINFCFFFGNAISFFYLIVFSSYQEEALGGLVIKSKCAPLIGTIETTLLGSAAAAQALAERADYSADECEVTDSALTGKIFFANFVECFLFVEIGGSFSMKFACLCRFYISRIAVVCKFELLQMYIFILMFSTAIIK